jgi:hypothetical protein
VPQTEESEEAIEGDEDEQGINEASKSKSISERKRESESVVPCCVRVRVGDTRYGKVLSKISYPEPHLCWLLNTNITRNKNKKRKHTHCAAAASALLINRLDMPYAMSKLPCHI